MLIDHQKELEIQRLVSYLRAHETAHFVSSLRIKCELSCEHHDFVRKEGGGAG